MEDMVLKTVLIAAGMLLVAVLSVAEAAGEAETVKSGNGVETAWVGVKCHIFGEQLATTRKTDLQLLERLLLARDRVAAGKLLDTGRAFITKGGEPVFVESREGYWVGVRPEGQLDTIWLFADALNCPKSAKKARKK